MRTAMDADALAMWMRLLAGVQQSNVGQSADSRCTWTMLDDFPK